MEHYCKICKKKYASYQSLWKHNKKYHNKIKKDFPQNSSNILHESLKITQNIEENRLLCLYCNKNYTRHDNKNRHEKICKHKVIKENILLKKELEEIKLQIKTLMNQNCKEHPSTLNKINKQLNINNINVTNNINIIQLGKEELHEILTPNEQIDILENNKTLENIIKYIHFNDKFPQFKNILITNQKNNIAYKYDKDANKFIATDKDDLIEDLIEFRLTDLGDLLVKNENNLKSSIVKKVNTLITKMDGDDIDFYENKRNDIKLLVYNNRTKVNKDININSCIDL